MSCPASMHESTNGLFYHVSLYWFFCILKFFFHTVFSLAGFQGGLLGLKALAHFSITKNAFFLFNKKRKKGSKICTCHRNGTQTKTKLMEGCGKCWFCAIGDVVSAVECPLHILLVFFLFNATIMNYTNRNVFLIITILLPWFLHLLLILFNVDWQSGKLRSATATRCFGMVVHVQPVWSP